MAVFTATAIATAVSVAGAASSYVQGKKAAKAQKNANNVQRDSNRLVNKQAKRQFLRNFRQSQANNIVAAVAAGVGLESSGVRGSLASERSQAQTALSEFDKQDELGTQFAGFQNKATNAAFRSATFGQISSFASSFVSFGSGGGGSGGISGVAVEQVDPMQELDVNGN